MNNLEVWNHVVARQYLDLMKMIEPSRYESILKMPLISLAAQVDSFVCGRSA